MAADLTIRPLADGDEAVNCARLMASTDPWITLGRDYESSLRVIRDPSREIYVAEDESGLAGFLILCMTGAFVGYIQTVLVTSGRQGTGIGSKLVAFVEYRVFRDSPNVFLCVSSFNVGARRLYERLGYKYVGELTDYIVRGHSELLFRKTRGPLSEFSGDRSRNSAPRFALTDLNPQVIAFLQKNLTEVERTWPRFIPELRAVRDVPLEELRTHPDLVERLAAVAPSDAPSDLKMLMGAAVLVTADGVIYGVAFGQSFLAFRADSATRAVASDLGAAPDADLGDDWIRMDPWTSHASRAQGMGDLRYVAEKARAFAMRPVR